jgi:hypothetical protein
VLQLDTLRVVIVFVLYIFLLVIYNIQTYVYTQLEALIRVHGTHSLYGVAYGGLCSFLGSLRQQFTLILFVVTSY